jgi:hypothetical protein
LGSNDRQMNTRSTAGSSKNKPTNEVSKGRVAGGGGGLVCLKYRLECAL